MKLKTNNKFSRWLFKLACKFGYSPYFTEPKVVYVTPKNLIELSCVIKVPEAECIRIPEGYTNQVDFINKTLCYEFVKNPEFRHNIKFTSKFNPEDNTTTIYAKLFILDKKGLEDFYERY